MAQQYGPARENRGQQYLLVNRVNAKRVDRERVLNLVGLRDRKSIRKPHPTGAGGMMTFLNPTEEDRLRVFLVAELARRILSGFVSMRRKRWH